MHRANQIVATGAGRAGRAVRARALAPASSTSTPRRAFASSVASRRSRAIVASRRVCVLRSTRKSCTASRRASARSLRVTCQHGCRREARRLLRRFGHHGRGGAGRRAGRDGCCASPKSRCSAPSISAASAAALATSRMPCRRTSRRRDSPSYARIRWPRHRRGAARRPCRFPTSAAPGIGQRFRAGMVLAIEPMVNMGGHEVEVLGGRLDRRHQGSPPVGSFRAQRGDHGRGTVGSERVANAACAEGQRLRVDENPRETYVGKRRGNSGQGEGHRVSSERPVQDRARERAQGVGAYFGEDAEVLHPYPAGR